MAKHSAPINSIDAYWKEAALTIAASERMLAQFRTWARDDRREMSASVIQTRRVIRETRELLRNFNRRQLSKPGS